LGEHSEAIAKELGYSDEKIKELVANGILGSGSNVALGGKDLTTTESKTT
jgi:hypothetical protein